MLREATSVCGSSNALCAAMTAERHWQEHNEAAQEMEEDGTLSKQNVAVPPTQPLCSSAVPRYINRANG